MKTYFVHILPNFLLVLSMIYIYHKLLNLKLNFKNHRLYVTIIFMMLISLFNYFCVDNFVKIVSMTLMMMIFFKYLFKADLKICIITPIFYQIFLFFAEAICAIILSILFKSHPTLLLNTVFGLYITNFSIILLSIFLFNLKFIKFLYRIIVNATDKVKNSHLIILCFAITVFLNLFYSTTYYQVKLQYLLILNLAFISVCSMIVIYSFKTENNYNKVSDKYNIAIDSLKDYEDMMSKYRIANHENKNLLLSIRAMIINKEKDIPKFIDSMVKERYSDDEKLLFKMNSIPSGGLRATIYSEILKIKEKNINYDLHLDKDLELVDLIELNTEEIIDICKIIGVFVDNAIEEVEKLKKKNITIGIYNEDDFINIKVSNNYRGEILLDKIYEDGYSTKGDGHGYGLSLVKNIIKENHLLTNYTEISKECFSQILKIRYKKIT